MAVPAYLCVGFVIFLLVYSGLNFLLVPTLDDPRNIRGMQNTIMQSREDVKYSVKGHQIEWLTFNYADTHSLPPPSSPPHTSVPPLYDIPITEVNKVMFDRRYCPRRSAKPTNPNR